MDGVVTPPIDHHQPSRGAHRLPCIRKQNPRSLVIGRRAHRVGRPNRLGRKCGEYIADHHLVAGVHDDADRKALVGGHDLHEPGRVLARCFRRSRCTHAVAAANDEIAPGLEAGQCAAFDDELIANGIKATRSSVAWRPDSAKRHRCRIRLRRPADRLVIVLGHGHEHGGRNRPSHGQRQQIDGGPGGDDDAFADGCEAEPLQRNYRVGAGLNHHLS